MAGVGVVPVLLGTMLCYLGVLQSGRGVRSVEQIAFSILFPLFVPIVPLLHRIVLRENGELEFRTVQLDQQYNFRWIETAVEFSPVALGVMVGAGAELSFNFFLGISPDRSPVFWLMTLLFAWSLLVLGSIISEWAVDRFEGVVMLFATWLVLVFGWDFLLASLVLFGVPDFVTNGLGVINPVGLYRFQLYYVFPDLRPAVQSNLPGYTVLSLGSILWWIVLPGWLFVLCGKE